MAVSPFWRPFRWGSVGEYPSTTSVRGLQRTGSWKLFVLLSFNYEIFIETNKKSNWTTFLHNKLTSPPSPEFDFPPNLFIAIAIASCVSLEIAPRDIPPVQKRWTMETADSTLPIGIGALPLLSSRRSRRTWKRYYW